MTSFLILLVSIAVGAGACYLARKRGMGKWPRRTVGVGVWFVALVILVNAFAPPVQAEQQAKAAPTKSVVAVAPTDTASAIKALAPDKIAHVEIQDTATPHQVWITLSQDSAWSAASSLSNFGQVALDVLKDGRAVLPANADVIFVLRVPTVDRYGNTAHDKVLNLSVKAADRERINFDSGEFTSYSLLNLAEPHTRNAVGGQMLRDFCADDDYAKWASFFCMKAANA